MTTASQPKPSVGATLLLLVGAAAFVALLSGLYALLGVRMPYFGLLYIVYWAAILQQAPRAFLPSVLGGLFGILMGWLLIGLPALVGPAGLAAAGVALAVVLFCFMRGHAALVINNATMLFLTVATISELKIEANALVMAQSLVLGAAYMGLAAAAAHVVTRRLRRGGAAAA